MRGGFGSGLAAFVFIGGVISAAVAGENTPSAGFARTGDVTSVPFGWLDFCSRHADACDDEARTPRDIQLTRATLKRIAEINAAVNQSVEPVSDQEHHGVIDHWDYPSEHKGDCEDYALLKRRLLIEAGFAREALLMTVVKEQNGDGHAVLTVRTDRGDYVLDNLSDQVLPWSETPYRFVKRQSQENQNVWVAIGAPTAAPAFVSK